MRGIDANRLALGCIARRSNGRISSWSDLNRLTVLHNRKRRIDGLLWRSRCQAVVGIVAIRCDIRGMLGELGRYSDVGTDVIQYQCPFHCYKYAVRIEPLKSASSLFGC